MTYVTFLQLAFGFLLLTGGGEALVKGAVAVAERLGISPLLIGLTLVGFGTSMPELVASLQAALVGSPGIAIGNVVGSNIANILLVLGVSAAIMPMATTKEAFRRDGTVLILASLILVGAVLIGTLELWVGIVFLVLLAAYTIYCYVSERGGQDAAAAAVHAEEAEEISRLPPHGLPLWAAAGIAIGGIVAIVWGADLLIDGALVVARSAGLSEAVIGLTLVAIGTSLPELATSTMAALRRHTDVAFGNIVGSNIFNILGILGVTAIVRPIPVPREIIGFDIWAMMAAALLLVLFAATGWRINRWEGAAFLAAYALYIAVQFSPAARTVLGIA